MESESNTEGGQTNKAIPLVKKKKKKTYLQITHISKFQPKLPPYQKANLESDFPTQGNWPGTEIIWEPYPRREICFQLHQGLAQTFPQLFLNRNLAMRTAELEGTSLA